MCILFRKTQTSQRDRPCNFSVHSGFKLELELYLSKRMEHIIERTENVILVGSNYGRSLIITKRNSREWPGGRHVCRELNVTCGN